MTTRTHQVTAIVGMLFAGAVVLQSIELQFFTKLGPGPGFFPLLLGALFGLLSFAWLIQTTLAKKGKSESAAPFDRKAAARVAVILVAMLGVAALMDLLGYQLTMFLFLLLLTKALGKQRILPSLIVALVGSVGTFLVFGKFLDLLLPTSSISFLASLGL